MVHWIYILVSIINAHMNSASKVGSQRTKTRGFFDYFIIKGLEAKKG